MAQGTRSQNGYSDSHSLPTSSLWLAERGPAQTTGWGILSFPAFSIVTSAVQLVQVIRLPVIMPVPVSVTNPDGKGLQAAQPSQLPETVGPFARLSSPRDAQQHTEAASQPLPEAHQADRNDGMSAQHAEEATVATEQLTFTYPGIGALQICI